MKAVYVISVGKLKDCAMLSVENEYLKRIKSFNYKIFEVKAASENLESEAKNLLKKVDEISGSKFLILLTEKGNSFDSVGFSQYLYERFASADKIVFLIGGAAGFGDEIINKANATLSLSNMTFPHRLTRVILAEQVYRAETISLGHPYSK